MRRLSLFVVAFTVWGSVAGAEPAVSMRIGAARFANGAVVLVPQGFAEPINIWLEETLTQVEVSTVRVSLNGTPMSAFLTVNRLPRGVRAIVRLGLSLGADFTLRGDAENVLAFSALDESKVTYTATFYLMADEATATPRLAPMQRSVPREVVIPPAALAKPTIVLTQEIPSRSAETMIEVMAQITDVDGLRRVVVEVNGTDEDEVLLQNERPVRKRRGWTARGGEPGTVTGDGRRITLNVPVRLRRDAINVIAIKAENLAGLIERIDRTVQTPR